jgi:hypothetical protein
MVRGGIGGGTKKVGRVRESRGNKKLRLSLFLCEYRIHFVWYGTYLSDVKQSSTNLIMQGIESFIAARVAKHAHHVQIFQSIVITTSDGVFNFPQCLQRKYYYEKNENC